MAINQIYLDNSTATKPSRQAIGAMIPYYEEEYGSLSQPHQFGQGLVMDVQRHMAGIYALFDTTEQSRFVFTSSGSEAISQVVASLFHCVTKGEGKNHYVARAIDEASGIMALSSLADDACMLTLAPAGKQGYVTPDAFIEACSPRTALFSCSWASALTGVIQPIEEIAAICKERKILFHLDATHVIGKLAVSFDSLPCDFLTFNGEQFHAPRGTGGLFVKPGAPLVSLIHGEEESKLHRGASFNVPLFAALSQAALDARDSQMMYCTEVARLRDKLETGILAHYPEAKLLFQDQERLPHISCISFYGIKSELLAFALSRRNVFACMGGGPFQHIEKVIDACHVAKPDCQCALSFSLSKDTTEEEIERAIFLICDTAKRLRRSSKVLL
jgi:cysteine desulfurase